jgi:putative flippase GtrA
MTPNSFPDNGLEEMQAREADAKSRQAADTKAVASEQLRENAQRNVTIGGEHGANPIRDNQMQTRRVCAIDSTTHNIHAVNDLRGSCGTKCDYKTEKNARSLIAPSTLVRWCKFNLVGGIGIFVQFAALFFLRSVMHFHYLAATAIAVEAAVVHNFVWHEQFTWVDRTKAGRLKSDRGESWRRSLPRLLRFNLSNGAVSILGNLALMKVMVGQGHMNYLLANAIAITLCSLANFLVSETWVFQRE